LPEANAGRHVPIDDIPFPHIAEQEEATFPPVANSMFGWLVADGWCWFILREEYCWLVAGGWFVLREKYCWLVADKPSEQAVHCTRRCTD
jgi:hypothetical protein